MLKNKEISILKFKALAERLSALKWLSSDNADDAKQQYDEFVSAECVQFSEKFDSFNELTDSVDKFFAVYLHKIPKYSALWKVCVIVFVSSHGQCAIEQGFSVNKQLLVENLKERSLISQKIVYDHINSHDIVIHQYELPSDLLKSCKLAYNRYNIVLKENKDQLKVDELSRKRQLIDGDILVMKKQKESVAKCIEILKSDADKLSIEAEAKRDLTVLAKANSFRSTILEKEQAI
nr:uncharacterized protein LOC124811796 [Hydra vulgaris]